LSDIVIAINPTRRVPEDALLVYVRELHVVGKGGSSQMAVAEVVNRPAGTGHRLLPAPTAASTEEAYAAPRAVKDIKNIASDLAPLSLPNFDTPPHIDPASTPNTYPSYHFKEERHMKPWPPLSVAPQRLSVFPSELRTSRPPPMQEERLPRSRQLILYSK